MSNLLARFEDVCRLHGDKTALRQGERTISYRCLNGFANQLAVFLTQHGVKANQHVALRSKDDPEYVIALLAVWKCKCTALPISHLARERELTRSLSFCEASFLIGSDEDCLDYMVPDFRLDATGMTYGDVHQLWTEEEGDNPCTVGAESNALLVHTSGTSSEPKTVQLTHSNLFHNVNDVTSYLNLASSDSILCILPFHYVYGISVLLTHLSVGGELVFGSAMMYPQQVVNELEQFNITGFSGVASTYEMLLTRTDWSQRRFPQTGMTAGK